MAFSEEEKQMIKLGVETKRIAGERNRQVGFDLLRAVGIFLAILLVAGFVIYFHHLPTQ